MYRSNRSSFNIPPPPARAYPWCLIPSPFRGGGNLIISPPGSGKFDPQPRFHVKSLGARIMADTVLVYLSSGRLCLCGQLVTRKGLIKPALCRIWRYVNFNIFIIGFRLEYMNALSFVYHEIQPHTYTGDSIYIYRYIVQQIRGQSLWPAYCMFINKVSDDACQWNGRSNLSRWDFFIERFACCITHERKLSIQWPWSRGFRLFAREFCS